MKRFVLLAFLLAATAPLAGCVVAPGGGGGWCVWHPYRCR